MILYKVVTYHRNSAVIKRKGYVRKYTKGTTVRAKKGSLGLICFRARGNANTYSYIFGGRVVEVTPVGKLKKRARFMVLLGQDGGVEMSSSRWRKLNKALASLDGKRPSTDQLWRMGLDYTDSTTVYCDAVKVLT